MSILKTLLFSSTIALALSSCGSSSSNSTSPVTTNKSTPTEIGFYVDSKISGISYQCGSQEGVTGEDGEFNYEVGQDCRFFIDHITLREVEASKLSNGVNIIEDNLLVAQLLQSLDDDGNANNGINIKEEVINAIVDKSLLVSLPQNEEEIETLMNKLRQLDIENFYGRLISQEDAQKHLNTTLIKEALKQGEFYFIDNGKIARFKVDENLSMIILTIDGQTHIIPITIANGSIYFVNSNDEEQILTLDNIDSDYILFKNEYEESGYSVSSSIFLYFDESKANEVLSYHQMMGDDTSSPWQSNSIENTDLDAFESKPIADNYNTMTLDMIEGKTFYFTTGDPVQGVHYVKLIFNERGSLQLHAMIIDMHGNIEYDQSYFLSYYFTNNQLIIDQDGLIAFQLISQDTYSFNLIQTKESDGISYKRIWYFNKPDTFPKAL